MERQAARARPVPTAESLPFWDGLAARVLRLRWCEHCARFLHPRLIRCPACLAEPAWRAVSGRASLESWTVVHRAFAPGFEPPYVVARVRPDEAPDVVLDTSLDIAPEDLRPGLPLSVRFTDEEDHTVYSFGPPDGSPPTGR